MLATNGYAQPDEFSVFLSLNILIGAAVAGLGSLWGVVVGAAFVALLPNISQSAPLIGSIHGQDVAFGVVVILVMLLLPNGFAGLAAADRAAAAPAADARWNPGDGRAIIVVGRLEIVRSEPEEEGKNALEARFPGLRRRGGLAAVATSATGAQKLDPGVTAKTIHIGGTFPFSGPAALYSAIPLAERAYFLYVNAHGGVNGRKIQFTYYDDAYDPSKTVPLTQKLVEQDKVFADYGSLGTAPVLATRAYLNGKKVPQVLVATGDSYWGTDYKKYPWTIGWQPDYPGEAKIYAKFINAKVHAGEDRRPLPERRVRPELHGVGQFAVVLDGRVIGRVGLLVWDTRTWATSSYEATGTHAESELGWALLPASLGSRLRDGSRARRARLGAGRSAASSGSSR